MARYTGPVCRLCRRENKKLFLKGERCYSEKCAMERRPYPPGQHGQGRHKITSYGLQLREKQKAKRIYGVGEKQFRRYFKAAERQKGITGENLLCLLERRLDNIVFRMGFARSRAEARQLVRHGHFGVNDRKVNIPSYMVKPNDDISVRDRSKKVVRIKESLEVVDQRGIPSWLEVFPADMKGRIQGMPSKENISVPVDEQVIVEFYSK